MHFYKERPGAVLPPDYVYASKTAPPPAWPGFALVDVEELAELGNRRARRRAPSPRPPWNPLDSPVPVPGFSSGLIPAGLDYPYLPAGTPVALRPEPPSRFEQFKMSGALRQGPLKIGAPVQLGGFYCAQTQYYNRLVGDIVTARPGPDDDSVVFDVRVPLRHPKSWWPMAILDQGHADVPISEMAWNCIALNQSILTGLDMHECQHGHNFNEQAHLPYLLVNGIPTSFFKPLTGVPLKQVVEDSKPKGTHHTGRFGEYNPDRPRHEWAERPSKSHEKPERRGGSSHGSPMVLL